MKLYGMLSKIEHLFEGNQLLLFLLQKSNNLMMLEVIIQLLSNIYFNAKFMRNVVMRTLQSLRINSENRLIDNVTLNAPVFQNNRRRQQKLKNNSLILLNTE